MVIEEERKRLAWVDNKFISKELFAPFIVNKDSEYIKDLSNRFKIVLRQADKAGADPTSIKVITKYKNKIIEALNCYYRADVTKCNTIIRNLVKDIGENKLAVSVLNSSYVFPGEPNQELQFFRCRVGSPANSFSAKDMLHLPCYLRAKSGNYRFSIPGNPSLYLANTSYGCWIETDYPVDNEFNVSPVLLDRKQKIFNLVVSIRDFSNLNEYDSERVHTWLKLMMLMITTSYRVNENGRTFNSEYIISQSIMMACKKLGYDGVAYYSKRVKDEAFARCAINLALFVDYEKEYSKIVKHMKMDDSFNFSIYKKLLPSLRNKKYPLRSVKTGFVTNVGNYDRQFPYSETVFYEFDQFLFANWRDKPNGKGKDEIPWGVPID